MYVIGSGHRFEGSWSDRPAAIELVGGGLDCSRGPPPCRNEDVGHLHTNQKFTFQKLLQSNKIDPQCVQAFKVLCPVYKTDAVFLLGWKPKSVEKWLRAYGIEQTVGDNTVGTMFTFDRSPWRVVWTKGVPKSHEDIAILVHEIAHLVTRIFWDRDVTIRAYSGVNAMWQERGDEPFAYLLEHYTREVLGRVMGKKSRFTESVK